MLTWLKWHSSSGIGDALQGTSLFGDLQILELKY